MSARSAALLLLAALAAAGCAWPQTVDFMVGAGAVLPLDPSYSWGQSVTLSAGIPVALISPIFLHASAAWEHAGIRGLPGSSVSSVAVGPGAGVSLRVAERVRLEAFADGGLAVAAYNDSWSLSWFAAAGFAVTLRLNPSFGIGAGARYGMIGGLYSAAGVFLVAGWREKVEDVTN